MEADSIKGSSVGSHNITFLSQLGNIHSSNMDAHILQSGCYNVLLFNVWLSSLFKLYNDSISCHWLCSPNPFIQVLKFNLTESGLLCVLPWLTMAVFANIGGWIADTLVQRGISVTNVRKVSCPSVLLFHV